MCQYMVTILAIMTSLYASQICGLENLALYRPTWQQYPWPEKVRDYGSENAVDGLYTDCSEVGGQCTISEDSRYTATWRVYLGKEVSISHIDIYYRTDNKPRPTRYTSRMAGFYLYVSNSTSTKDAHLCFHEMQTLSGTPSEVQRINCSSHGQYVIYYNERKHDVQYPSYYSTYAYNELCEVEIYGCREYGYYGDSCMYQCPKNCLGRRCDINSGHCLACIIGFQGQRCDQVCENQTYGLGCSLRCGKCINGETCNHVNGSCLHGCSEGVQGYKCQEECHSGYFGKDCKNKCNVNCKMAGRCDKTTGQCEGGCIIGWTGNMCNQKVSENPCNDSGDVLCPLTIVLSVALISAGSVLHYFCWKRQSRKCIQKCKVNFSSTKTGNEESNEDTMGSVQQYMEIDEAGRQQTNDAPISYTNLNLQL